MQRFYLFYPVRPHRLNQAWGIPNPIYNQFGFRRHNGQDLGLVNGQKVYTPIPCDVVFIGYEAKGAGHYVILRTQEQYLFNDERIAYAEITFMHMQRIDVSPGQRVFTGDVLGLGDNTGFSTGSHTHMRCRRVRLEGSRFVQIDPNDAQNSFDQQPYWNNMYADVMEPVFHYQFTKDLTYGMENGDVKALQKALQLEDCFPQQKTLTEFYGDITLASVKAFQRKYGIINFGSPNTTGYGRVGRRTREKLNILFR